MFMTWPKKNIVFKSGLLGDHRKEPALTINQLRLLGNLLFRARQTFTKIVYSEKIQSLDHIKRRTTAAVTSVTAKASSNSES